jgi:hypothetical protein
MMPSMDLTYVKKIHHNFQVISMLESSILSFAPLQSTYDNNQLLMRLLISQTLSEGETIKNGTPLLYPAIYGPTLLRHTESQNFPDDSIARLTDETLLPSARDNNWLALCNG